MRNMETPRKIVTDLRRTFYLKKEDSHNPDRERLLPKRLLL